MKKIFSMLCVVLAVGFGGTAFSEPPGKVDVCHSGSVYTGDTTDGAIYDSEAWETDSFVIRISEKAVAKHIDQHGDLTDFLTGDPVTTMVVVNNGVITGFETQTSCF